MAFHSRIVTPTENELVESNWVGRKRSATTQSVAVENEPDGVGQLIADVIETHEEFKEVEPTASDWLKKSLLYTTTDKERKQRVKQLLGSNNYIERLSPVAWDDLQKFCHEQAMSIGYSMEMYSKKNDLPGQMARGLGDLFLKSAYGKPQHADLMSTSSDEAKHRYVVIPDERAAQKRMTVWGDPQPFKFGVRQDDVMLVAGRIYDGTKSQLWNEKAYIHCLRMIGMAVDLRFQSDVKGMCTAAGGSMQSAPIKDFARMRDLCQSVKHHGRHKFPRPAHNLDINRNCSTFDTPEDMLSFVQALQGHDRFGTQPIRVDNTFTDDDATAKERFYHRVVRGNWLYSPGITYKELLASPLSDMWERYHNYETVEGHGSKDPHEPWQSWREQIELALDYLKSSEIADEQVQIIVETQMLLTPFLEAHLKMHVMCKICLSPSQKALYHEFSAQDQITSDLSFDEAQDAALAELNSFLAEDKERVNRFVDEERGISILCQAAANGHYKVVQKLMKKSRVDANQPRTDTGATPLYLACQHGHVKTVKLLLENPRIRVNQSRTDVGEAAPLHIASQNGHDEVVQLLVESPGLKVNQAMTLSGRTAIFVAAYYGHEKVVEHLMEDPKCRINQTTKDGTTPLYIAAQQGHAEIVQELLNRKDVMVNAAEKEEGRSPLNIACLQGHVKIVDQLLAHGAINVNHPSSSGATPLFMAAQEGNEAIVKMLLGHKSIKIGQARTVDKATPLQIAKAMKHDHVVELLEAKVAGKESCSMM